MRLLLDSHTLIWSQDETYLLSQSAIQAIADPANDRYISTATVRELAIKYGKGRLLLSKPITFEHTVQQTSLATRHGDPFDRLLISQSLVENMPIVGKDQIFDAYGIARIWD